MSGDLLKVLTTHRQTVPRRLIGIHRLAGIAVTSRAVVEPGRHGLQKRVDVLVAPMIASSIKVVEQSEEMVDELLSRLDRCLIHRFSLSFFKTS
jgi:hypothetical protein